jgi:hypothetical protein
MSRVLCAAVSAAILLLFSSGVQAATIAIDNAANAPYTTWDPGDNGGTGWAGGWIFRNQSNAVLTTTNGQRGWFAGDSRTNDNISGDTNGDFDINTPSSAAGKAWGLYSNGTTLDQVYAIRPFSALAVGNTIKWDIDNGNIASTQVVGLRLLSNANDITSRVFEHRFVGGDANYTTFPAQTTSIGFTREGLRVEYTLISATTYSLKVTRKVDGVTQTITGSNVNANPIVALAFKNQFAGSGANSDAFLNNISIMSPNVGPTVADHVIPSVNASDPGMVSHMFTAIDPDMDPLTWSGFALASYTPFYGGMGTGPAVAATFDANTQQFSWNSVGSPRGIYQWKVTASDGQASDEGRLTVHVTAVPEPSTIGLCSLVTVSLIGLFRRHAR